MRHIKYFPFFLWAFFALACSFEAPGDLPALDAVDFSSSDLGVDSAEADFAEVLQPDLGLDSAADSSGDRPDFGLLPDVGVVDLPDASADLSSWCGDGVLNLDESCDIGPGNGQVCVPDYGSSCGYCTEDCKFNSVLGGSCGDGQLQGDEACDGGVGCVQCQCASGYVPSNGACVEIDECVSNPCDSNATCQNLPGAFQCECNVGYMGNGFTCDVSASCATVTCLEGERCEEQEGGQPVCIDINECALPGDICGVGLRCENRIPAVQGETFRCRNVDECLAGVQCGSGTVCVDHHPLVTGLQYVCEDIDECGGSPCASGATCQNLVGGFECTCPSGTVGDGFTCRPFEVCGDGVVEGFEACDEGAQNGQSCSPIYPGSCTWCASDCATVEVEESGLCGDGVRQGTEQCDDGGLNSSGIQCDPWEDCPSYCDTSCNIVAALPATCQQYVGDLTMMAVKDLSNPTSSWGKPVWVAGDYDCAQVHEPLVDVTQYCSVEGNVYLRLGSQREQDYVDSEGNVRTCTPATYGLQEINSYPLPLEHISGDMVIESVGSLYAVAAYATLEGLNNLRIVEGDVRTYHVIETFKRPILRNAGALGALEYVGGDVQLSHMEIEWCSLQGCAFDSLTSVGGNLILESLRATHTTAFSQFNSLETVGGSVQLNLLTWTPNALFVERIEGFSSLHTIGGNLTFERFPTLLSVPGFPVLTQVMLSFKFLGNPGLSSALIQGVCLKDPSASCVVQP
jgi:hypothetical protein